MNNGAAVSELWTGSSGIPDEQAPASRWQQLEAGALDLAQTRCVYTLRWIVGKLDRGVLMSGIRLVVFDLDDTLFSWKTNDLFPEVNAVLSRLKNAGCRLGLASYNAQAPDILEACGVSDAFDFIEYEDLVRTARIVKNAKLHAADYDWKWCSRVVNDKTLMLHSILSKAQVPPHQALFVDDQERFLAAARELGMQVMLVGAEGVTMGLFETVDLACCGS